MRPLRMWRVSRTPLLASTATATFFARQSPRARDLSNCHVKSPRATRLLSIPTSETLQMRPQRREMCLRILESIPLMTSTWDVSDCKDPFKAGCDWAIITVAWGIRQKRRSSQRAVRSFIRLISPRVIQARNTSQNHPRSWEDSFWLKKGTFKTVPNSHAVCFTCHNADSGLPPDSKDCHVCHKLLQPDQKLKLDFNSKLPVAMGITDKTILGHWSRRVSAGAFRHEGGEHPDLACTGCHNVSVMNTLDQKSLRVPVKSCGGGDGCHITVPARCGALNSRSIKKADAGFVCTNAISVLAGKYSEDM